MGIEVTSNIFQHIHLFKKTQVLMMSSQIVKQHVTNMLSWIKNLLLWPFTSVEQKSGFRVWSWRIVVNTSRLLSVSIGCLQLNIAQKTPHSETPSLKWKKIKQRFNFSNAFFEFWFAILYMLNPFLRSAFINSLCVKTQCLSQKPFAYLLTIATGFFVGIFMI